MAKAQVPLTIQAPGFLGLNTQQAGDILPVGWATKLENFVYDNVGRLASRNGNQQQHAAAIGGSPTIKAIHEYKDASGNTVVIGAAGNSIYSIVGSTVTDITGSITAPTDDNWQFANFNDLCVGFQVGHPPIELATVGGTFADSGGTQFQGNMVLSMAGRIWTVFDNDLKYSDLLINNFTGGSSGAFDLATYWPNGQDNAVALAEWNDFLIVMGENSMIIFEGADDVNTMNIVDGIDGIGCVARDSVQKVGTDLAFLSNTGVRGLGRTIQEKSVPINDFSRHVRDDLIADVLTEIPRVEIKSIYNPVDGFYLLTLPDNNKSYYFDLKFPQEDGSWKVSTWDFAPTAAAFTEDLDMYIAVDDGFFSIYTGFVDNLPSSGTGGNSYNIDFEGVWNDFGQEVGNFLKIPKRCSLLASGAPASAVTFKWALDYAETFRQVTLNFAGQAPAAYGIAQWGIDTYLATGEFERVRGNLASAGQVIQVGVNTTINGSSFAMQRIDVLAKIGRLAL